MTSEDGKNSRVPAPLPEGTARKVLLTIQAKSSFKEVPASFWSIGFLYGSHEPQGNGTYNSCAWLRNCPTFNPKAIQVLMCWTGSKLMPRKRNNPRQLDKNGHVPIYTSDRGSWPKKSTLCLSFPSLSYTENLWFPNNDTNLPPSVSSRCRKSVTAWHRQCTGKASGGSQACSQHTLIYVSRLQTPETGLSKAREYF